MAHISIDTHEYLNSHGREPRGRGLWLFSIGIDGQWKEVRSSIWTPYAQARRDAVQLARAWGRDASFVTVKVLP